MSVVSIVRLDGARGPRPNYGNECGSVALKLAAGGRDMRTGAGMEHSAGKLPHANTDTTLSPSLQTKAVENKR